MKSYKKVFVISVLSFFTASYIKPCVTTDPKFLDCALQHGNEAIPYIAKGKNVTVSECW
jgi:hypothetical protein